MHDIWNPWHGCVKVSEGCEHCYMYYLDRMRESFGGNIYRTKNKFYYPLEKNRYGSFKIKSGETIRVCMTSDFFLKEADKWRAEAWEIMRMRSDVLFYLLTKRPERVIDCLPTDWGDGYENVLFNVTAENQRRADERIPILLELPFKHKGLMCAPLLGEITISEYLSTGQIEIVTCGGENYDGSRECDFEWVKKLNRECAENDVTFCFSETGSIFIKDGVRYKIPSKRLQSEMAFKSGMNYQGKRYQYILQNPLGQRIPDEWLHKPTFISRCDTCAQKIICNGCAHCGKCE